MARYRAKDIVITAGSAVTAILSGTLRTSASTVETTAGGQEHRTRKPGYKDWSLGGTSRFEGATLQVNDEVECSFVIGSGEDAVQVGSGTGIIDQWEVGGDHDGGAVDVTFNIIAADELSLGAPEPEET